MELETDVHKKKKTKISRTSYSFTEKCVGLKENLLTRTTELFLRISKVMEKNLYKRPEEPLRNFSTVEHIHVTQTVFYKKQPPSTPEKNK